MGLDTEGFLSTVGTSCPTGYEQRALLLLCIALERHSITMC